MSVEITKRPIVAIQSDDLLSEFDSNWNAVHNPLIYKFQRKDQLITAIVDSSGDAKIDGEFSTKTLDHSIAASIDFEKFATSLLLIFDSDIPEIKDSSVMIYNGTDDFIVTGVQFITGKTLVFLNTTIGIPASGTTAANDFEFFTAVVKEDDILYIKSPALYDSIVSINGLNYIDDSFRMKDLNEVDLAFNGTESGIFINFNQTRENWRTEIQIKDSVSNALLAFGEYRPDKTGLISGDIAELSKSQLIFKDVFDYSVINLKDENLSKKIYIEFREVYRGNSSEVFVSDSGNPIFITQAVKQIQETHGQNMGEYVLPTVTNPVLAKFLTKFDKPVFFDGYPFDISFIHSDNIIDLTKQEDELLPNKSIDSSNDTGLDDTQASYVNRLRLAEGYASNIKSIDLHLKGLSIPSTLFTSAWTTTNTSAGSSNSDQIKLPLISTGTYDFFIDWGDGQIENITAWNQAETTHTYSGSGSYTLKIWGTLTGWAFNNLGDLLKITDISEWDIFNSGNEDGVFYGCSNLNITATDAPNLSTTTQMFEYFRDCSSMNGDLDNWDVSGVTDMNSLFLGCSTFNQSLNNWDVSLVTEFNALFLNCTAFNGNITSWEPLLVTNMTNTFNGCAAFNQAINGWNVSSVLTLLGTFKGCSSFNKSLNSWNVGTVTVMSKTFQNCTIFNQSLNSWNVSGVTLMNEMFENCIAFNSDITGWTTTALISIKEMFKSCTVFNQAINGWDVSNVTNFQEGFRSCVAFNRSLNSWDVSSGSNYNFLFGDCTIFNGNITAWTTTAATNMQNMFINCVAFNQNISGFDLNGVTTTLGMFEGCTIFNQNISSWDVSTVSSFESMFENAIAFNQNISGWTTTAATNFQRMFEGATSFDQNIGGWDVTNLTTAIAMFEGVTLSTSNYDALLVGWEGQAVLNTVTLDGGNSNYTSAGAGGTARAALIADHTWTIVDGGGI